MWPSGIRFGSHWSSNKITWANIVNAVLNIGTKNTISGAVYTLAQPCLKFDPS